MDNPPNDGPCAVTITAPDRDWLQSFVRKLVEERLASAAHLDVMHTTYRWSGAVHEADEARAILHTTRLRLAEIVDKVREEHDFDVACVAAQDIVDGSGQYLSWIAKESSA